MAALANIAGSASDIQNSGTEVICSGWCNDVINVEVNEEGLNVDPSVRLCTVCKHELHAKCTYGVEPFGDQSNIHFHCNASCLVSWVSSKPEIKDLALEEAAVREKGRLKKIEDEKEKEKEKESSEEEEKKKEEEEARKKKGEEKEEEEEEERKKKEKESRTSAYVPFDPKAWKNGSDKSHIYVDSGDINVHSMDHKLFVVESISDDAGRSESTRGRRTGMKRFEMLFSFLPQRSMEDLMTSTGQN